MPCPGFLPGLVSSLGEFLAGADPGGAAHSQSLEVGLRAMVECLDAQGGGELDPDLAREAAIRVCKRLLGQERKQVSTGDKLVPGECYYISIPALVKQYSSFA